MNNQKALMTAVFLALVGSTTGLLLHAKGNQKLGEPGVLTRPAKNSKNLEVVLPQDVPGYKTEALDQPDTVVRALPDDTSFGRCLYTAPDGFRTCANVVLMGTDRSSIHKPQICLTGQGWKIDDGSAKVEEIHMTNPVPYDLPVMHLTASLTTDVDGQPQVVRGVYLYWFVDADKRTAENMQIMWWMAQDLVFTGELDRFAYIAYFSDCAPGKEEATYERMKQVIIETVPKYQLTPKSPGS